MRAAKPSDVANLPVPFGGHETVSVKEAATALSVCDDTIWVWIGKGKLTASKPNRRTLVHVASILKLLDETRVVPKPRVRHRKPWQPKPSRELKPGERPHHRRGKSVQVLRTASATTA